MRDLPIPPSTSASQLVSYAMCPRKYAAHYVLDLEPEFTSIPLIVGSVVHSGAEWWFGERIAGRAPAIDDALGIVAADIAAATAETRVRWRDHTPETLEAQARELLRTYLTEYGNLPVVAVEQPFEVGLENPRDTGWCLSRPFKGYFDLVLDDHTVVELKTSSKAWPDAVLLRHLQVGGYAFTWNALHAGPSKVDVHVIVKNKKPRVDVIHIERGEPDTFWWFQAVADIEQAIEARQFPPSPGPLCIECEYQGACARWAEQPMLAPNPRRLPVVRDAPEHALTL